MKKLTGFLAIPFAVLVMCWLAFAGPVVMQQSVGGAGSGDVATDAIWDAAGDLAQGTGANTAAKLTKGAEGTIVRAGAASNAYTTATYPATSVVNQLLYSSATNVIGGLAVGAEGSYLRTGASPFAPVWSTLLLPNSGSAFYLPVFTAANTMGQLAASGTTGQVLTAVTGAVPAWTSGFNGTVGATTPAAGTFTSVSVVRADTPQTVTLYEATSDGNNLATLTAPAKGVGYTGDRTVTMPDSSGTVAVLGTSGNVPDAISFSVDGGGSAISTGLKTCMVAKHKMTLTGWTLIADQSGAIKIDVWKDTYANYQPTNADTITNAHEPEIAASGLKAQDTDIADWTTVAIAAGDVVCFNVDSCATITWAHLALTGYRIN